MVFSRKRKDNRSPSFILDDSPKRTKVQAQRKFAQGSNVNSPVLTPVEEIEQQDKVIPEPIELVPMKRPNTEDFLTFLCFRGTPVLPPSLNFFNNASMVDTRPQTNDQPTTSPKNGVILTSTISKTQGERPFIAFGVRKRADPIVVSRHMDKKRRHALALQALRRKYQEQKMAKIRAITISKLSEKVQTNKTVVRTTRSITKSDPITKKNISQKTKITVVATKHVKVTTRRTSLKQPVRSNMKQKMCLRSYRGRFVQRELLNKPVKKRTISKDTVNKGKEESSEEEEFSSDDNEPLMKCVKPRASQKITKKTTTLPKKTEITYRLTRSNQIMTRRHPTQARLLVRAQNKLKSPPNSPRLRSHLQRKIKVVKKEITLPIKKKVITKKIEIKRKCLATKLEQIKIVQKKPNVKIVRSSNEREVKRKKDEATNIESKVKKCDINETIFRKQVREIESGKGGDKNEQKRKSENEASLSEKRTTRETTKKKTEETIDKRKGTNTESIKAIKDIEKKRISNDLFKSTRSNDTAKTLKSNELPKAIKSNDLPKLKVIEKKTVNRDVPKTVKETGKKSTSNDTMEISKSNDLKVKIIEKKGANKDSIKNMKDSGKKSAIVVSSDVMKNKDVPKAAKVTDKKVANKDSPKTIKESGKKINDKSKIAKSNNTSKLIKGIENKMSITTATKVVKESSKKNLTIVEKGDTLADIADKSNDNTKIGNKDVNKKCGTMKGDKSIEKKNDTKIIKDGSKKINTNNVNKKHDIAKVDTEIDKNGEDNVDKKNEVFKAGRKTGMETDDSQVTIDLTKVCKEIEVKTNAIDVDKRIVEKKTSNEISEKTVGCEINPKNNFGLEINLYNVVQEIKQDNNLGAEINLKSNVEQENNLRSNIGFEIINKCEINSITEQVNICDIIKTSAKPNDTEEICKGDKVGKDNGVRNAIDIPLDLKSDNKHIDKKIVINLDKVIEDISIVSEKMCDQVNVADTRNIDKQNTKEVCPKIGFLKIREDSTKKNGPDNVKGAKDVDKKIQASDSSLKDSQIIKHNHLLLQVTESSRASLRNEPSKAANISEPIDLRTNYINILEDVKIVAAIISPEQIITPSIQESEKNAVNDVAKIISDAKRKADEENIKNILMADAITRSVMEVMDEKRKSIRETRNAVFEECKKIHELQENKHKLVLGSAKEVSMKEQPYNAIKKTCIEPKSSVQLADFIEKVNKCNYINPAEPMEAKISKVTKQTTVKANTKVTKKQIASNDIKECRKVSLLDSPENPCEEIIKKETVSAINAVKSVSANLTKVPCIQEPIPSSEEILKDNIMKPNAITDKVAKPDSDIVSKNEQQFEKIIDNALVKTVDDIKEKTITDAFLNELMNNKNSLNMENLILKKKLIPFVPVKKTPKTNIARIEEPQITRRPTRKTKEAAAIYMEILGHKLGNNEDEDDNNSIDSFPELPNVRKMQQRENELKAKAMIKESEKPVEIKPDVGTSEVNKDTKAEVVVKSNDCKPIDLKKKKKLLPKEDCNIELPIQPAKNPKKNPQEPKKSNTDKKLTKNVSSKSVRDLSSDSDKSFIAEIKTPPEKLCRQTRNRSPKLYKSFSDTDSEPSMVPVRRPPVKRKSNNANSESDNSGATKNKKKLKKTLVSKEDSFDESDEEPLVKLAQKKTEEIKMSVEEPLMLIKQKRECTKRPQNYLPLFSSSDEEEKYFHGFVKSESPPKPLIVVPKVEPAIDLLSTKDVGRRYGKEKVNMSNEQIEKWLNDSALAGMSLIKKENDEMLKFGEKIPTETSLDTSMLDINTEGLKDSLLKPVLKDEKKVVSPSLIPEKYVVALKPFLNERKTIFRKEKKEPSRNVNAFSVCNESSVYAFEADHEDLVSTPFRRPSRRPSSTTTSRSEDDLARLDAEQKAPGKFRHPNLIRNDSNPRTNIKPEISLILSTDESNNSGSAQVALETTEEVNVTVSGNEHLFYIPLQPGHKSVTNIPIALRSGDTPTHQKFLVGNKVVSQNTPRLQDKPLAASSPMCPPTQTTLQKNKTDCRIMRPSCSKSFDRLSENSEEFKYKVPSSPSASSSSSAKLYKRQTKSKSKSFESYAAINTTEFPSQTDAARIVEAPVFHPNEKEFIDPMEYIEKIRSKAEKFGICRIVPPPNFKPECKVLDEMRFTAYNQYVHKMMHRWGPNFRELVAIRKYLATQSISLKHPPWIGGMEIDLPRLYQTVQTLGGLKEVIEKKKWPKVSELMKIPKSAQDRVTKLDDIYCKYLLPYDTLSPDERDKLFDSVETEWAKRESRNLLKAQQSADDKRSDDEDIESEDEEESDVECILKGRSMALSAFYRIARNTMAMWFKSEPGAQEVEEEFWKHVTTKQFHICVHSGSIDSGNWGYGFAVSKNSPFARHAWNLKVLTNNSGSVLRYLGPVMGLTVPTLHVGMVFSGCCWYRDPHSLPWIEYLHTGGNKIWYGIPDSMSKKFHSTLLKLVPNYCLNKSIWLPSDTAMLPPNLLVDNGVSLTRTVQEPGQFVVIFPKAFTSNICTGYVVSESVFFATPSWLNCAEYVFDELRQSCEPSMFSHERLLLSVATDPRSDINLLNQIIPTVTKLCEREISQRQQLKVLGVTLEERLPLPDNRKKKKTHDSETEYACEDCRWNLFCSMVFESQENAIYCLEHAIKHIQKKSLETDKCKLMYTYNSAELNVLVERIKATIEAKIQKKAGGKYHGMATLLT